MFVSNSMFVLQVCFTLTIDPDPDRYPHGWAVRVRVSGHGYLTTTFWVFTLSPLMRRSM